MGLLLKDKKIAVPLAAELDLESEEIALLIGSTSTTKKVQTIYEEAQRMRAAEVNEEIELAWHSTAQRSLAGVSQEVQAGGSLVSEDQANSQSPSQEMAKSSQGRA